MSPIPSMSADQPANLPPSVLATPSAELLRRLELSVTRRLDGILQGDYRGLVPGHGSDLGETRIYQPGDDVRRMDWNVTARLQAPHVRETIADRELETWAMVDLSASLGFGTADCLKRDLAVAALAAVGFLTSRAGNRIGAITLEGERLSTIPARTGRNHLLASAPTSGDERAERPCRCRRPRRGAAADVRHHAPSRSGRCDL